MSDMTPSPVNFDTTIQAIQELKKDSFAPFLAKHRKELMENIILQFLSKANAEDKDATIRELNKLPKNKFSILVSPFEKGRYSDLVRELKLRILGEDKPAKESAAEEKKAEVPRAGLSAQPISSERQQAESEVEAERKRQEKAAEAKAKAETEAVDAKFEGLINELKNFATLTNFIQKQRVIGILNFLFKHPEYRDNVKLQAITKALEDALLSATGERLSQIAGEQNTENFAEVASDFASKHDRVWFAALDPWFKSIAERKAQRERAEADAKLFIAGTPSVEHPVSEFVDKWLTSTDTPARRAVHDMLQTRESEYKEGSQERENIIFWKYFIKYLTDTRDVATASLTGLCQSIKKSVLEGGAVARITPNYLLLIACVSRTNSLPVDNRPIFTIQFLTDVLSAAPTPQLLVLAIRLVLGMRAYSVADVVGIVGGLFKDLRAKKDYAEWMKALASLNADFENGRMTIVALNKLSQCSLNTVSDLVFGLSPEEFGWVNRLDDAAKKAFIGVSGELGEPFFAAIDARVRNEKEEKERKEKVDAAIAQAKKQVQDLAAYNPDISLDINNAIAFLLGLHEEDKKDHGSRIHNLFIACYDSELRSALLKAGSINADGIRNIEFWSKFLNYLQSPNVRAAKQLLEEYRKSDYGLFILCLKSSNHLQEKPIFTIDELTEMLFLAPSPQIFTTAVSLILGQDLRNRLMTDSGPLSDIDIQEIVVRLVEKFDEEGAAQERRRKQEEETQGLMDIGILDVQSGPVITRDQKQYADVLYSSRNDDIAFASGLLYGFKQKKFTAKAEVQDWVAKLRQGNPRGYDWLKRLGEVDEKNRKEIEAAIKAAVERKASSTQIVRRADMFFSSEPGCYIFDAVKGIEERLKAEQEAKDKREREERERKEREREEQAKRERAERERKEREAREKRDKDKQEAIAKLKRDIQPQAIQSRQEQLRRDVNLAKLALPDNNAPLRNAIGDANFFNSRSFAVQLLGLGNDDLTDMEVGEKGTQLTDVDVEDGVYLLFLQSVERTARRLLNSGVNPELVTGLFQGLNYVDIVKTEMDRLNAQSSLADLQRAFDSTLSSHTITVIRESHQKQMEELLGAVDKIWQEFGSELKLEKSPDLSWEAMLKSVSGLSIPQIVQYAQAYGWPLAEIDSADQIDAARTYIAGRFIYSAMTRYKTVLESLRPNGDLINAVLKRLSADEVLAEAATAVLAVRDPSMQLSSLEKGLEQFIGSGITSAIGAVAKEVKARVEAQAKVQVQEWEKLNPTDAVQRLLPRRDDARWQGMKFDGYVHELQTDLKLQDGSYLQHDVMDHDEVKKDFLNECKAWVIQKLQNQAAPLLQAAIQGFGGDAAKIAAFSGILNAQAIYDLASRSAISNTPFVAFQNGLSTAIIAAKRNANEQIDQSRIKATDNLATDIQTAVAACNAAYAPYGFGQVLSEDEFVRGFGLGSKPRDPRYIRYGADLKGDVVSDADRETYLNKKFYLEFLQQATKYLNAKASSAADQQKIKNNWELGTHLTDEFGTILDESSSLGGLHSALELEGPQGFASRLDSCFTITPSSQPEYGTRELTKDMSLHSQPSSLGSPSFGPEAQVDSVSHEPLRELSWWEKFKMGWNKIGWKKRWAAIGFMLVGGITMLGGLAIMFVPGLQVPGAVLIGAGKYTFTLGVGATLAAAGGAVAGVPLAAMSIGAVVEAGRLPVLVSNVMPLQAPAPAEVPQEVVQKAEVVEQKVGVRRQWLNGLRSHIDGDIERGLKQCFKFANDDEEDFKQYLGGTAEHKEEGGLIDDVGNHIGSYTDYLPPGEFIYLSSLDKQLIAKSLIQTAVMSLQHRMQEQKAAKYSSSVREAFSSVIINAIRHVNEQKIRSREEFGKFVETQVDLFIRDPSHYRLDDGRGLSILSRVSAHEEKKTPVSPFTAPADLALAAQIEALSLPGGQPQAVSGQQEVRHAAIHQRGSSVDVGLSQVQPQSGKDEKIAKTEVPPTAHTGRTSRVAINTAALQPQRKDEDPDAADLKELHEKITAAEQKRSGASITYNQMDMSERLDRLRYNILVYMIQQRQEAKELSQKENRTVLVLENSQYGRINRLHLDLRAASADSAAGNFQAIESVKEIEKDAKQKDADIKLIGADLYRSIYAANPNVYTVYQQQAATALSTHGQPLSPVVVEYTATSTESGSPKSGVGSGEESDNEGEYKADLDALNSRINRWQEDHRANTGLEQYSRVQQFATGLRDAIRSDTKKTFQDVVNDAELEEEKEGKDFGAEFKELYDNNPQVYAAYHHVSRGRRREESTGGVSPPPSASSTVTRTVTPPQELPHIITKVVRPQTGKTLAEAAYPWPERTHGKWTEGWAAMSGTQKFFSIFPGFIIGAFAWGPYAKYTPADNDAVAKREEFTRCMAATAGLPGIAIPQPLTSDEQRGGINLLLEHLLDMSDQQSPVAEQGKVITDAQKLLTYVDACVTDVKFKSSADEKGKLTAGLVELVMHGKLDFAFTTAQLYRIAYLYDVTHPDKKDPDVTQTGNDFDVAAIGPRAMVGDHKQLRHAEDKKGDIDNLCEKLAFKDNDAQLIADLQLRQGAAMSILDMLEIGSPVTGRENAFANAGKFLGAFVHVPALIDPMLRPESLNLYSNIAFQWLDQLVAGHNPFANAQDANSFLAAVIQSNIFNGGANAARPYTLPLVYLLWLNNNMAGLSQALQDKVRATLAATAADNMHNLAQIREWLPHAAPSFSKEFAKIEEEQPRKEVEVVVAQMQLEDDQRRVTALVKVLDGIPPQFSQLMDTAHAAQRRAIEQLTAAIKAEGNRGKKLSMIYRDIVRPPVSVTPSATASASLGTSGIASGTSTSTTAPVFTFPITSYGVIPELQKLFAGVPKASQDIARVRSIDDLFQLDCVADLTARAVSQEVTREEARAFVASQAAEAEEKEKADQQAAIQILAFKAIVERIREGTISPNSFMDIFGRLVLGSRAVGLVGLAAAMRASPDVVRAVVQSMNTTAIVRQASGVFNENFQFDFRIVPHDVQVDLLVDILAALRDSYGPRENRHHQLTRLISAIAYDRSARTFREVLENDPDYADMKDSRKQKTLHYMEQLLKIFGDVRIAKESNLRKTVAEWQMEARADMLQRIMKQRREYVDAKDHSITNPKEFAALNALRFRIIYNIDANATVAQIVDSLDPVYQNPLKDISAGELVQELNDMCRGVRIPIVNSSPAAKTDEFIALVTEFRDGYVEGVDEEKKLIVTDESKYKAWNSLRDAILKARSDRNGVTLQQVFDGLARFAPDTYSVLNEVSRITGTHSMSKAFKDDVLIPLFGNTVITPPEPRHVVDATSTHVTQTHVDIPNVVVSNTGDGVARITAPALRT